MAGRIVAFVVFASVPLLLGGCGDDGDADSGDDGASTSTSHDPRVDDPESEDDTWSSGSATLEVGGERHEFTLDFCAIQPAEDAADSTTITLQVDGTSEDDPGISLQVVESTTSEPVRRIQVVSVHFEDADGSLLRTWEAQRVLDPATGEIDDLHGEGTTPLLDIEEDHELAVEAADAAFWQFDMTGEDDRLVGTGTLVARCVA